jgi:hypothetical protein
MSGEAATLDAKPEALDWLGEPLDCRRCDAGVAAGNRCVLAHACVHDRYARRIDRYFDWNPGAADRWLTHPYFEVRAIAVRHASMFRLAALACDPDETVRLSVAARLPQRLLPPLMNDPHREVRIRVAARLEPAALIAMCRDPDYYVRLLVARRLPSALLSRMVADIDTEVRREVAARLSDEALASLEIDPEISVRCVVARRAVGGMRIRMAADPAWEVRREIALRADPQLAAQLQGDSEAEVAQAARLRLVELAGGGIDIAGDSHG